MTVHAEHGPLLDAGNMAMWIAGRYIPLERLHIDVFAIDHDSEEAVLFRLICGDHFRETITYRAVVLDPDLDQIAYLDRVLSPIADRLASDVVAAGGNLEGTRLTSRPAPAPDRAPTPEDGDQ